VQKVSGGALLWSCPEPDEGDSLSLGETQENPSRQLHTKESVMTPPANSVRLIGHKARFAEAIAQIDAQLEYDSGAVVAARRDEVVAAARAAYGPSEDFRGIRDAWDAVFPNGVYSASGLARATGLA
jgi:hypothetical protein